MNAEAFWSAYREELAESVRREPSEYWTQPGETPEAYAERVAAKFRASGLGNVHTNSPAFRRTCKRLGIPFNRKAMLAATESQVG